MNEEDDWAGLLGLMSIMVGLGAIITSKFGFPVALIFLGCILLALSYLGRNE